MALQSTVCQLTFYRMTVAIETMNTTMIALVNFLCTIFLFVCSINCTAGGQPPAGGAFYAADKWKKCAEKVNKHIQIVCNRFNSDYPGVKGLKSLALVQV